MYLSVYVKSVSLFEYILKYIIIKQKGNVLFYRLPSDSEITGHIFSLQSFKSDSGMYLYLLYNNSFVNELQSLEMKIKINRSKRCI